METTIKEKIYLAALLHDIGKFYQRADKYDSQTNLKIRVSEFIIT